MTVMAAGRLRNDCGHKDHNWVIQCRREEVGPGFVCLYRDDLATETQVGVLRLVLSDARSSEPYLSERGWDETGSPQLDAFGRVRS